MENPQNFNRHIYLDTHIFGIFFTSSKQPPGSNRKIRYMLIVFHKAVQRISARIVAMFRLFFIRYSQTIKETFKPIINISALLKQPTGVFVAQEQDVQGAGQIERISDNRQEPAGTLNGDRRTQINLIVHQRRWLLTVIWKFGGPTRDYHAANRRIFIGSCLMPKLPHKDVGVPKVAKLGMQFISYFRGKFRAPGPTCGKRAVIDQSEFHRL